MSNYTKGPWRVSDEVAHRVIDDCATIAHCNVSSREGEEARANARLIAAAPELLEALKAVVETDKTGENFDMTLNLVYSAIAKAEGK